MSGAFKMFVFALLLAGSALVFHVHALDQTGFISIDCGLPAKSSYTDETTNINYVSDETFIDTGELKSIPTAYQNGYQKAFLTLRSFPKGTRNCYKINVKSDSKYLVRASFYYGNYDGENKLPEFELHLGPSFWETINFDDATSITFKELIHYIPAKRNYLHVCLVDTGSGVPIISKIELRLMPNNTYETEMGSLQRFIRLDIGQSPADATFYRFPDDIYDRLWNGYNTYKRDDWTPLNTSSTIDLNSNNYYQPASVVMSTAATPKLATDNLTFYWESKNSSEEFYVYMHFAELEKLPANQSRNLEIRMNGELFYGPFEPSYLYTNTIHSTSAMSGGLFNFSIGKAAGNTDVPPILNAIEIYEVKVFSEAETNLEDVNAITAIKSTYKIEKNWQGDPCSPKKFSWEGLICSYPLNDSPRIISLDLSSSGLTGEIDASISELTMIQTLDLSNNNLTGPIPESLSALQHLNVLNLENNMLTGAIPNGLTERTTNGFLSLSLCDNPNLTGNVSCKRTKKKKKQSLLIPIIGSIIGVSVLLLAVLLFFYCRKRRGQTPGATVGVQLQPPVSSSSVELDSLEQTRRNFTYAEILEITNNKQRILGKGGFGTVYHGYIDKTQVAVKLLSSSSSQGLEQFHAEVNLLLRVHHTNLTSLVGYCNDETNKGLIYEYMAKGNLQEYLSGLTAIGIDKSSHILTWEGRLQIATDAAIGLEYLHYGCKPPMIHRDVKTTNILLSENFQAKLSDFGLSRNFPADDRTHIVTGVAGTPGYLAPEYKLLNQFNEKSDVYSFGIVLLEIITGRPAVTRTRERIALNEWVGSFIPKGDIDTIVDPRMQGNFDTNLAWKFVELAMACVNTEPSKRPTMSKVVGELKQCLEVQLAQITQNDYDTELGNTFDNISGNGYSITMLRPSVR